MIEGIPIRHALTKHHRIVITANTERKSKICVFEKSTNSGMYTPILSAPLETERVTAENSKLSFKVLIANKIIGLHKMNSWIKFYSLSKIRDLRYFLSRIQDLDKGDTLNIDYDKRFLF